MWGIIKKAINSTLGTKKFQPLDVLIEKVVNDDDNTSLNQLLFKDKKIIASEDNIYCYIDSLTVSSESKKIDSNKRLFIHAEGDVSFRATKGILKVFKNGASEPTTSNSNIKVACHDYFDFSIENKNANNFFTTIFMKAEAE